MTIIEIFAKAEHLIRPILSKLPPELFCAIYSSGRKKFLNSLVKNVPKKPISLSLIHRVKLWDITFSSPLFNAAGMFKDGRGYYLAAKQGAGAFLAGTTTSNSRSGNYKKGIWHPFIPYPKSKSASNWLGLPNPGHSEVAKILSQIEKQKHCPIGASLSTSPDDNENTALHELVQGLIIYEKANVDFIELNESCPNVAHNHSNSQPLDADFIKRLEFISQNFLAKRNRKLPVIIKLSNDFDSNLMDDLIDIATTLNFDGINFGNTSTDYTNIKKHISDNELNKFEYFTKTFGGGISGKPLKSKSLALCTKACEILKNKNLKNEFHIIRTGGIESYRDIIESKEIGVNLNQWFTGYFDYFAKFGHKLYLKFFNE